jgi:hypothetical protein
MRSVTTTVSPMLGVFLMAMAVGVARADPPPAVASAPSAGTAVSPVTVKANPEDKVICKTEVPTGSRLGGHRTCMRKSDWDAQTQDARHKMDFRPPTATAGGR